MREWNFENTLSLTAKVLSVVLGFAIVGQTIYEIAKFFYFDFPLNYYEPELVIEAWALSQGQLTHPPYEIGPFSGLYAPYYQILASLFFRVLPASLLIMRLISLVSVIAVSEMVFRLFRDNNSQQPEKPILGRLVSFLLVFSVHNVLVGFDIQGKPDSLATFLALSALFLVAREHSFSKTFLFLASAFIAALAVATKQTMLFMAVAIALAVFVTSGWKKAGVWFVVFLASSGLIWFGLREVCGPMLFQNAFVTPGQFPIRWAVFYGSLLNLFLHPYSLISVIALLARVKTGSWSRTDTFLFFALVFSYPASVLTAAKAGGMNNAYQPFLYIGFLINARNIGLLTPHVSFLFTEKTRLVTRFVLVAIVFSVMHVNIPSEITRFRQLVESKKAYEGLIARIQSEPGNVFVPMDNYLPLRAGKPLNYSLKSELDVYPTHLQSTKNRHSLTIALKSDLVLTHSYSEWYKPGNFEDFLIQNGFFQEKKVQLDYNLIVTLWKRNPKR